ncbi:endo-1,4-beta-xylanase [Paenibacillus kobensis]|uniref:endo-1,4-beta-xylanase n=1 Tax=Paenibacillus kobensis TaxID=59841 RepID=UPI000FD73582|nr:endo-1,4-beta-xylanase [Paenibacillus kobensis]
MSRKLKRVISMLLAAALLIPTGWLANGTTQAAAAAATDTVYHQDFSSGSVNKEKVNGSAHTSFVTGKVFAGNDDGAAMYVDNRTHGYDAIDLTFADLGLVNGQKYTYTVTGYLDSTVTPAGKSMVVQTAGTTYSLAYASAPMVAGSAFTITKEFTMDSSQDKVIRIQTDESNDPGTYVPFYIGDILIMTPHKEAGPKEILHDTFATASVKGKANGAAQLSLVTNQVFNGNADGTAVLVGNRANNWDGVDYTYADLGLQDGHTYTVTTSVYVDANTTLPSGTPQFLLQSAENDYGYIYVSSNMVAGGAATLTKEFTYDASNASTRIRIHTNDAGATVPFYIGDVLVTEKVTEASNVVASVDFENQSDGGFVGRGNKETLTVTNAENHTTGGQYALKVEGRQDTWQGPSLNIASIVKAGYEYKISLWAKLSSSSNATLRLSTQIGGDTYVTLQSASVTPTSGWVKLEGTYRYFSNSAVTIYVESGNKNDTFYIDDVSIEDTGSGPIILQSNVTPLKDAYANLFPIGTAIVTDDVENVRNDLLKMHFNIATAGNGMKPDALQGTKGTFTFDSADAMVNKVLSQGMQMHGHVLVWHQQTPAWMNTVNGDGKTPLTRQEALDNLRTHITTVMGHFQNKVVSWDVVNEAMNDNPSNPSDYKSSLRDAPWKKAIGDDYVEQAFLIAREVLDAHPDWNIKLYYNDYNEDNQNKATAIYNMVKDINDRYKAAHNGKLLIDGVGMQAHYNTSTKASNVERSLDLFLSLGVQVSITELDIMAGSNYVLADADSKKQAYLYAQVMKIFKDHAKAGKDIGRVTFWGVDDATSWRAENNPLLFDKKLQVKEAYYAVIDPDKYLSEHQQTATETRVSTAVYGTPVIDGTIDSIWNNENIPVLPIDRYQSAWQGAHGQAKALWDDQNLYVLFQVTNAELDKSSTAAHEQDSVEIFVDQNNGKTASYEADDGQYRVNYDNEKSFNPAKISEGFDSATVLDGTNYTVEVKIPLTAITPANDTTIGFDVQINDGKAGSRQSIASWNDVTGQGWQDTSGYGELTLSGKVQSPTTPDPNPNPYIPGGPTPKDPDPKDPVTTDPGTTDPGTTPGNGSNGNGPKFKDVPANNFAAAAIQRLVELGIINGVSSDSFAPKEDVKRSQLVVMLVRALGLETNANAGSPFADVPASRSDAAAIAAAVEAGLINGANGSFRPNDSMTREEAVVVLMRAFNYAVKSLGIDASSLATVDAAAFKDDASISKWASENVALAVSLGLVTGDPSGKFRPQSEISRAETAVLVDRVITLLTKLQAGSAK